MSATSIHLTVAEGKRLIAKAVAALPEVRSALSKGLVVVCKGSTNAYIVEELTGRTIDKATYLTGNTQPARGARPLTTERIPELILRDGAPVEGLTAVEAAAELKRGDVLMKGANALSPDRRMAGVLVGDPTGGTVGKTAGHVIGKGAVQLIPVGLEKTVAGDLWETAARVNSATAAVGHIPRMWISQGRIITEVEAFGVLSGACVTPMGAGGINGAEGAVWLLIEGSEEQVAQALKIAEEIYGEPPISAQ